jgi:hypothetical protein
MTGFFMGCNEEDAQSAIHLMTFHALAPDYRNFLLMRIEREVINAALEGRKPDADRESFNQRATLDALVSHPLQFLLDLDGLYRETAELRAKLSESARPMSPYADDISVQ